MENDPVFIRFTERRDRLINRLDSTRIEVDNWIAAHKTSRADVSALAQLEGLLAERRNMLEELMKLDDSFLDHLVILLGRDGTHASG